MRFWTNFKIKILTLQPEVQLSCISSTPDGSNAPSMLLTYRLLQHGLKPLEVGGDSDCFFRAVWHKIFGAQEHHPQIRATGIQYLQENPELFIESNTESSWLGYLSSMSQNGTWCDNIIQAVANAYNIIINIIESAENFADISIIYPTNSMSPPTSIYVGHIDEVHYVSTVPITSLTISSSKFSSGMSLVNSALQSQSGNTGIDKEVSYNHRREYMKEYMKNKRGSRSVEGKKQRISERKNYKREYMREYKREYMRKKWASSSFQNKDSEAKQVKRGNDDYRIGESKAKQKRRENKVERHLENVRIRNGKQQNPGDISEVRLKCKSRADKK